MALQNTRENNYPEWYQNVITAADMAEISASPGCMVIKPWGYGIWERIQKEMDERFKETGHDNCYFPLFIPLSFFQKEAEHVDGFAKEMAVVTHSRLKNENGKLIPDHPLEEPLVVRPTSETIIADAFSKWVKSYRDLPVLINQWANVVRWEMRPRIFLRTREFLWQEGHTAHATKEEAVEETILMMNVYADVMENCLAMPVIKGTKPDHERFPGAVDTYCLEAMMQDGRALQAGTSHYLGQTFAKSADIKFQSKQGTLEYVHTTSWGTSTRLIGGLIMSHSDDEGLVVPPVVAPYQVVIVPIIKKDEDKTKVMDYIEKIKSELKSKSFNGEKIRIKIDARLKDAVDKNWEWTRKGTPIICEIGPRDVDNNGMMMRIRTDINTDNWKQIIKFDEFINGVSDKLAAIQNTMFDNAKKRLNENTTELKTAKELEEYFKNSNSWIEGTKEKVGFIKGKWNGKPETEEKMKELKITIRCIPLEQSNSEGECLISGEKATTDVIYARSY